MAVHRWNTALDGEFSETALRGKLESMGYQVAKYVYSPGTVFPDHKHGVDKIDAVVAGRFRLIIGGHLAMLGPGDWVEVPNGVMHNASVVGDEPVVSLDAVKAAFPGSPRVLKASQVGLQDSRPPEAGKTNTAASGAEPHYDMLGWLGRSPARH